MNNRLLFKIKDGYKLEIQTPETIKLFGSTKKKKKKMEKMYQVLKQLKQSQFVVIYQIITICKSEVLYTSTPNKSYAYFLNIEPSNLVFLKTYNTQLDEMIITFTDQNGRPLEIEDKINSRLLISKQKCDDILQNQEQENMLKDMDFYYLLGKIRNNYWIQGQMLPKSSPQSR